MANVKATTGLPKAEEPRYHFDIYAVLEGAQEMYFGHEVAVNVNLVETVRVITDGRQEIEKCYLSPTKRRGVERRTLIWAPLKNGLLLGDKLGCGVPHTCGRLECPICVVYGALIPGETTVDLLGGQTEKRSPITLIGRVTHGGGVAIQEQDPVVKQRAMHPSNLHKPPEAEPTPTLFKREYNEPALLYPVYNHCLSVTEDEFQAVAYAFLDSLARIGAGNPKGVKLYEGRLLADGEPLLVLDRYLAPLGKRPVISPSITDVEQALDQFRRSALTVTGETINQAQVEKEHFTRWLGEAALVQLQNYAAAFVKRVLEAE